MIKDKKIAVVVPSYNEALQIGIVIDTMPDFVDRIVIVDDNSSDGMADVVLDYIKKDNTTKTSFPYFPDNVKENLFNRSEIFMQEKMVKDLALYTPSVILNSNEETDRIILIQNKKNSGVGGGIARGYKWCLDHGIDCVAVMAGDGQMDPDELYDICEPVVDGDADYTKGNRLRHPSSWYTIPKIRFFGNSVLSILTKIASGYWKVSDTQTGYTAISVDALKSIQIHKIYPSYGMPNDIMVRLNTESKSLKEITIKPVYDVGEQSKMKIFKVIPRVSFLLFKLFFFRLFRKYLFKEFHPLFISYIVSIVLFFSSIPYGIKIIMSFVNGTTLSYEPLLAFVFLFGGSYISLMFAMYMDIQDNKDLYK